MKIVLLTRQAENNQKIRPFLEAKNYHIIEQEFVRNIGDTKLLGNLVLNNKIILVTSSYAAQLIIDNYADLKEVSAYVVGQTSCKLLESIGIKILASAENIASLIPYIPNNEEILYLRGNYITEKIPRKCVEYIIYHTEYEENFLKAIEDIIRNRERLIITIFSTNTAYSILKAIENADLKTCLSNVEFYCFSKKIADIFHERSLRASYPNQPELTSFLTLF